MLQYIVGFASIFVVYKLVTYLKWKREVCYHLEKIGGPKSYPFIGTLHLFFGVKRSDVFKVLVQMMKDYGPIFRTYTWSRPEVIIMKPEHLEQILTSSVHIKKGKSYDIVREWLGDGLFLSVGSKWHQRRKMITPAFHFKILEHFMDVFVEKAQLLIEHLEEKCSGKGFDIYPYITHCTLDIICETAMGVTTNAMSTGSSNYTKAIYEIGDLLMKKELSFFGGTPLYRFLQDGKAYHKNLCILHNFTDNVIKERKQFLKVNPIKNVDDDFTMSKKKRLSFLDLLLDASESLSDEDIRAEVDTFMFGGHDTTTAAICWSLLFFGLNQDVQEKAYLEIKTLLGDRKSPRTISDLNELKYLECCIKESLRLYPSAPFIGRFLSEDIEMDGYKIPKGTDIILSIYNVHRNPDIYPDPEKYDPDRFLPENCKKRHPYAYIPFSAGPRNCIGQKFAMYEEKTLLATILKNYRIIPVDTLENLNVVAEIILRPKDSLNIALEKRNE